MPTAHKSSTICTTSLAKKLGCVPYIKHFAVLTRIEKYLSAHPDIGHFLKTEIMRRIEQGLWPELFACTDPLIYLRQVLSRMVDNRQRVSWVDSVAQTQQQCSLVLS